jgi:Uma2 family endonuclease
MDTITIAPPRLTAEAFASWSMEQQEGERYELYDGVVVRVPNEGSLHGLTKARIAYRLMAAIEAAGLDCFVYIDAMKVKIDDQTSFEPDIVVRRGDPLGDRETLLIDPLIAVEVMSPSSMTTDLNRKRDGYLRVPTLRHYLIVDADARRIVHHRRGADGIFISRTLGDEPVTLDPPGIVIDRLFP